jgi:hypothetical protein
VEETVGQGFGVFSVFDETDKLARKFSELSKKYERKN